MKAPRLSRQIFWGAAWLNVANWLAMATNFLSQLVLVRHLGLAEYGSMQIVIAAFDLTSVFFDFNLYYSAIRFGGEALAKRDQDRFERVFSAAFQLKLALGTILLLLATGTSVIGLTYEGHRLGTAFVLLALNYLLALPAGYIATVFSTEKNFGRVSLLNSTLALVTSLCSMAAAVLWGSMVAVIAAQCCASLAVAAAVLIIFRKRFYIRRLTRGIVKDVGLYAGQFAISSIMKRVLGKTDMLIVAYFLSAREAGLYRIAQSFASPIYSAVGPLWNVLFPIVSELSGKGDYPRLMTLMLRGSRLLTVLTVPAAALISLLIAPFLRLAYNVDAPEALTAAILLFWTSAITATIPMLAPIMRVYRNDVATAFAVAASSINVILDLLLVPYLGIAGCALSMLLTFAGGSVFMVVFVYRLLSAHTKPTGTLAHFLLVPAGFALMLTAIMRSQVATAAGAVGLIAAVLIFRLVTITEVRELLAEIRPRWKRSPSASSAVAE